MTETMMGEKSGKLKVTVELEVNDELMGVVKEAISKAGSKLPEMMRGGGAEKKEKE
jgi:ribosomal protein L16/L10AE